MQTIADDPKPGGFSHCIVAFADLAGPQVEAVLERHCQYRNVRAILPVELRRRRCAVLRHHARRLAARIADVSRGEHRQLFRDNAARFYRL